MLKKEIMLTYVLFCFVVKGHGPKTHANNR